ncbi:hypothetical protein [Sphingobium lactosutens]|uniref:hypothetical protein n=1 Tax=Sphingobium lactosutens TaxID=522773 RepID=UPI0021189D13|nr:hypothetical protein [Sphingobium lactosutens]
MPIKIRAILSLPAILALGACGIAGCERYASRYSCDYVESRAEYEVWYWKNVAADNEEDEQLIGRATGLRMCRENAIAHSQAIDDEFSDRSYICALMENGKRMEKHRL